MFQMYCILYIVQYTMLNARCTMYIVQCTLYNYCTMYIIHIGHSTYAMCTVQCAVA